MGDLGGKNFEQAGKRIAVDGREIRGERVLIGYGLLGLHSVEREDSTPESVGIRSQNFHFGRQQRKKVEGGRDRAGRGISAAKLLSRRDHRRWKKN